MVPGRYDITIYKGATFYLPFAVEAPDGTTYDLPDVGDGYDEARMTVRDVYGGTAIDELTSAAEIVLEAFTDADGNDWSGYVLIDASVTETYEDFGDGVWDLEITDGLHVERVLMGVARLSPEATT